MDTYAYKYENNLYINLTNKCCNRCAFCIRDEGDGIGGSPSLWLQNEPTSKQVIDAINAFDDYDEIVFCGYGEPTYRLEVMLEVCSYIKSLGKKIRLNTNGIGSLINKKDIAPLLKDKVDIISVSLNESSSEKYDALCKPAFKNAYSAILEFTTACVKHGIDTTMSVVRVDGLDVDECARICDTTGAKFRVREKI